MDGATERARGTASAGGRGGAARPGARPGPRRGAAVLAALMLAAFTFNTAENLPIGLLELISADLRVPVSSVGLLITGYGVTVAVASVPLAHGLRAVPRRHVLTGVLAALVVSSLVAAVARSYGLLLAARLVTALAQALFRAVMGPVAVGLFPPRSERHRGPAGPLPRRRAGHRDGHPGGGHARPVRGRRPTGAGGGVTRADGRRARPGVHDHPERDAALRPRTHGPRPRSELRLLLHRHRGGRSAA